MIKPVSRLETGLPGRTRFSTVVIVLAISMFYFSLLCTALSLDELVLLARLFRRKSRAIVIARSSSLLSSSSCKNFNVAHYSKYTKISTPNLEYLLIMTKCRCRTRDITLKFVVLELCPLLT